MNIELIDFELDTDLDLLDLVDITENLVSKYTLEELQDIEAKLIESINELSNLTDEEILNKFDTFDQYNNEYFRQLEMFEWFVDNNETILELYNMNLGGNNEETT